VSESTAVVLGLGANGLGVVRALARSGIRVFGVDNDPDKPGSQSRYGEKLIIDQADIRTAFREGLSRIARRGGPARPVLLPSNDEAVEVLHEDREELRRHFRILVPPADAVERLMDKLSFDRTAREAGLATPRTWLLTDDDLPTEGPWMLKPRRRYGQAGVRLDVPRRIDGPDELARVTPGLIGRPDEYVLQEMVPGDDDRLEFYGACWKAGRPVAEFTGAKIRQYPRGSGSTACAELTDGGRVLELSRLLLERFGYEGCVDVEFKTGNDGRHYIIEVNARTALWHVMGQLAGVSLPLAAFAAATGQPFNRRPVRRVGKRWVYLERDLRAVRDRRRSGEADWKRFVAELPLVRRFAVFSVTDPAPFVGSVQRIARRRHEASAARATAAGGKGARR